jgi:hypothetical protein
MVENFSSELRRKIILRVIIREKWKFKREQTAKG